MLSSLDLAPLSNNLSGNSESILVSRQEAGFLYTKASSRGKWHTFIQKFRGKGANLRDLGQVETTAKRLPAKKSSVVIVPIEKIVGSEGRVQDFDHDFHPLSDHNYQRWINIAVARRQGRSLPPVELIQVGEEYYVRDGHHRVSVASAMGQKEIEAHIQYALAL